MIRTIERCFDGFSISMTAREPDNEGRYRFSYVFCDNGEAIFFGDDFSSPAGYDDMDCMHSLLTFFTLREGDTDGEYFDKYTDRQIAWRDSDRRDILGMIVCDFENERE